MALVLCRTKEEIDRKMDFGKEEEDEAMQKKEIEMDIVVPFISNVNHSLQSDSTSASLH